MQPLSLLDQRTRRKSLYGQKKQLSIQQKDYELEKIPQVGQRSYSIAANQVDLKRLQYDQDERQGQQTSRDNSSQNQTTSYNYQQILPPTITEASSDDPHRADKKQDIKGLEEDKRDENERQDIMRKAPHIRKLINTDSIPSGGGYYGTFESSNLSKNSPNSPKQQLLNQQQPSFQPDQNLNSGPSHDVINKDKDPSDSIPKS